MKSNGVLHELNIPAQCKKYGFSFWQCPQFLFLVMGLIIILSTLSIYFFGTHYIADPLQVALFTLLITAILFVIGVIITRSFERLAEANRLKSEFVSIVSHQLRSPLSNLKWALDLIISGRLGKIEEKQVEYFRILKENSTRMEELVSDLLIVSRIETDRLPFKKKWFLLETLTKELIEEFRPLTQASNIKVNLEFPEEPTEVLADPSQINLVIENLLDNAIRYSMGGGIVEIKIEKRNKHLYFEIKDAGVGIPKEDQKYIFQKFFRSENVMRYQTQGSGLGLYISKAIIEKSGGKIGFKSEENKGSTFWFTLQFLTKPA